jgi:hypothetical protein
MPNLSNFLWFDCNSNLFKYKSWSSSLRNFLSSPLPPLYARLSWLAILFSYPPKSVFLPQCETPSSTPTQNSRQAYCFVYFNVTYSLLCLSFIAASCLCYTNRRINSACAWAKPHCCQNITCIRFLTFCIHSCEGASTLCCFKCCGTWAAI